MNFENKDYYEILGVTHDASLERIQRAYDRARWEDMRYWDENLAKAYSVLSDSNLRKEYDEFLQNRQNEFETVSVAPVTEEPVVEEPVVEEPVVEEPVVEEPVVEEPVVEEPVVEEPVVEESKNDDSKTYEEIYQSNLDNVRNETMFKTEPKKEKTEESKFKKIGKYVGGTLVGFAVMGPIGAVGVALWMKNHNKKKLQKGEKSKKIKKVTTEEIEIIEQYNKILDKEINRLLSEPHNSYRLEICRAKYENQVNLLAKLLELKINTKPSKGIIKYKFEIMSLKNQLDTARKNLSSIKERIAEYDETKRNRLNELNIELDQTNQKIAKAKAQAEFIRQEKAKQGEETQDEIQNSRSISNVKQINLERIRNKKANIVKFAVQKTGAFYDKMLYAKDFVKSLVGAFKSSEDIDALANEELSVRVR